MSTQQPVYILGIVNLFLAGIAILCVVQAEDHPEYFALVYIAVCIFIFYMGTILVIIILQIMETCQGQQQRREQRRRLRQNQSLLHIQIPILATQISSQLNAAIDESLNTAAKAQNRLSRSQTLPSTLSPYNPHQALSTSTLLSTLRDLSDTSSGLLKTSTQLAVLSNHQPRFATIHRNYQSFAFITNDHHHPS